MKEYEFLICGKVAGHAPRCFSRLNVGEEPGAVAVTDWQRFGIYPIEVRGVEGANYAKFHALEKKIEDHVGK